MGPELNLIVPMRNLLVNLLIILVFSCCSNECANYSIDKEKLRIMESLIKKIEETNIAKERFYLEDFEDKISSRSFEILDDIDFHNIEIVGGQVYVITMGSEKFNILSSKLNGTTMCSYYLFYPCNSSLKDEISYFEGYANCRISYEEISPQWTLVVQNQNCED